MGETMKIALLATVLLLAACAEAEDGDSGPDAHATAACRHFRNVASDAGTGIMNDDEIREKLIEVHDNAQFSEEPGIAEHSEGMLAAVTQGDMESLGEHVDGMAEACRDATG